MDISLAQTQPQSPTEQETEPQPPTYRGTGRATEPPLQPETEPQPHPLKLQPGLSVEEHYDDNINLTSSREHDFITSVMPRLSVSYVGVDANLAFGYEADIEFYADHSDLNTTKHVGSLSAGYRWSPTLKFQVQDSFDYSPDATDFNPTGVIAGRANQYNNSATASVTKDLSLLTSLQLTYSNELQTYSSSTLFSSTIQGFDLTISHNYTPADTMSVSSGIRHFTFSQSGDEKVYSLSVGWRHRFSTDFSLNLTAGSNMFKNTIQEYSTSGLFDLALVKSWKYGSADLRLAQDLSVSGGFSSGTSVNRSVVVNVQRNLAEKARVNLSVSYATNNSISGPSVDTSEFSGSTGFEYDFTNWLKSRAGYSYFQQNSSTTGINEFKRNQVFVSLTATLPEK